MKGGGASILIIREACSIVAAMGQNLSEPKTEKKTENVDNDLFSVGSSCMQGWRLGGCSNCNRVVYAGLFVRYF